jgi:transposase
MRKKRMSSHGQPKQQILRANGTLNPQPDKINDPLFRRGDFFDPHDLLQVKYEMVRRVEIEGWSVTQAAQAFGVSRPVFYQARAALQRDGLQGLIPHKRGPKRAYKLSTEVMSFVQRLLHTTPQLVTTQLARAIHKHFGLAVHPRSIARALARQEKKRKAPQ